MAEIQLESFYFQCDLKNIVFYGQIESAPLLKECLTASSAFDKCLRHTILSYALHDLLCRHNSMVYAHRKPKTSAEWSFCRRNYELRNQKLCQEF